MKNHFTFELRCKKYVKTFLENTCGSPVELCKHPDLYSQFRRMLDQGPGSKGSLVGSHEMRTGVSTRELTRRQSSNLYQSVAHIIITKDWFYRYGWNLSYSNEIHLNNLIENKVKFTMRQFVSFNNSLGIPVSTCILEFQKAFGFNEDCWSFESIKKDFSRNGQKSEIRAINAIREEVNTQLLKYLTEQRIISKTCLSNLLLRDLGALGAG